MPWVFPSSPERFPIAFRVALFAAYNQGEAFLPKHPGHNLNWLSRAWPAYIRLCRKSDGLLYEAAQAYDYPGAVWESKHTPACGLHIKRYARVKNLAAGI